MWGAGTTLYKRTVLRHCMVKTCRLPSPDVRELPRPRRSEAASGSIWRAIRSPRAADEPFDGHLSAAPRAVHPTEQGRRPRADHRGRPVRSAAFLRERAELWPAHVQRPDRNRDEALELSERVGAGTALHHPGGADIRAERIYEPNYESGKPVRWAVEISGDDMGIAGIWADHPTFKSDDGEPLLSFAMLTVSGEGHPVFQRLHGPEDEKRMVVILEPADYTRWLDCPPAEATEFFRQYVGPLAAHPAPRSSPKATGNVPE